MVGSTAYYLLYLGSELILIVNANVLVLGGEETRDITETSLESAFLYPIGVNYGCAAVLTLLRGLTSG
jgi:hypothetical protein